MKLEMFQDIFFNVVFCEEHKSLNAGLFTATRWKSCRKIIKWYGNCLIKLKL